MNFSKLLKTLLGTVAPQLPNDKAGYRGFKTKAAYVRYTLKRMQSGVWQACRDQKEYYAFVCEASKQGIKLKHKKLASGKWKLMKARKTYTKRKMQTPEQIAGEAKSNVHAIRA